MSAARQNFSKECEGAINDQINMELYASYVYQSMAFYFDRIALKGTFNFFQKSSDEERGHAKMLMEYQNLRGGQIALRTSKLLQWNGRVTFMLLKMPWT